MNSKMLFSRLLHKKYDWSLFWVFLALNMVGLASLFGIGIPVRPFFTKQLIFVSAGMTLAFGISFFDYRMLKNYSLPPLLLYLFSMFLLLLSFAFSSVRGINAWIVLGGIRIEPSEFAKLAVIILLAKYFSQKHVEIYRVHHIIASGLYVALPAFLVLLQPDLGSAFIFFVIWLSMLLAAGIKRKHLLVILFVATLISSVAWFSFLEDYQKNRIISFVNPYLDPKGEGYNIIQSRIAVGSGQFWGNGFGRGTQAKYGFLPEAHTDFAFAAFAEQFGFAGVAILFAGLGWLFWRIGRAGFSSRNNFSKLFAIGFMMMMFSHVMINAGMNLGLLPITGIPFPFLSYGGSFIISLTIGLGIMESIRKRS